MVGGVVGEGVVGEVWCNWYSVVDQGGGGG